MHCSRLFSAFKNNGYWLFWETLKAFEENILQRT